VKRLSKSFYSRDTIIVAKKLLGKILVRKIGRKTIAGIIIETEAYRYKDDPASHAYKGMTERNKAMFGEVGRTYVYFTYGMYFCFNVIARNNNFDAGAVLIRALKPTVGIKQMMKNRGNKKINNLTNGPGKLTQAMEITKKQYGEDLTKTSNLYITEGLNTQKKFSNPRIGIRRGTKKLWNFKIHV